jgi:hypothetical protein
MLASFATRTILFAIAITLGSCAGCRAATRMPIPPPATDSALAQSPGRRTAVFAGGCFWVAFPMQRSTRRNLLSQLLFD